MTSSSSPPPAASAVAYPPGETLLEVDDIDPKSTSSSRFKFDNDYILDKKLRSGSYGVVYTTRNKVTNEEFAVKVIDRTKLKLKDDDGTFREVKIMKDLCNIRHVVRLIDFYVEPQTFYVVQVFAQGGDVFDRLADRTTYTEKDSRDLAIVLLQTLVELHQRKICHRDLKPENLLLKDKIDDTNILLADFGFAKYVPPEGLKTRCGTPAFVAPEILIGQKYGVQADMWSAGCLIYMLIGGYPPFQDESHRGLFRKIRAADFTFHDMYWSNVSLYAKQLISKLLTVDPRGRLTAHESLLTTWLEIHNDQLSRHDLSGSIEEIKKFDARRKLKSAIHAVAWSVANPFRHDKISDLLNVANRKDEEKSMTISEDAVDQAPHKFNMSKTHKHTFEDLYELGPKIHRGSYAIVKECTHKQWEQKYAVKIIERRGSSGNSNSNNKGQTDESVLNEVAIMNQLDHPHIVKVIDFFEDPDYYFVVMELMAGGDVFDRIIDMKSYTEKDARDLFKILLEAVEYMHRNGIAHRDLKPQNLLLQSKDNHAEVKVADFGFAKKVHTPKSLTSKCGTPSYVAPEILKNQPYDQSSDMWSVGVVLYVMLCGYTPFLEDQQQKMFERIKQGDWSFDEKDWEHISEEAKDLIKSMLTIEVDRRISAMEALRSKWIMQGDDILKSRDLSQSQVLIKEKRPGLKNLARAFMGMGINTKRALKDINPIASEHGESTSSQLT